MSIAWLRSPRLTPRQRARRRAAALCVALAMASSLLAACSQGSRQVDADRIRRSVRTTAGHPISGTFKAFFRPIKITGSRPNAAKLGSGGLAYAGFAVDTATRRSALTAQVGGPSVFLGVGRSLYARRTTTSTHERRPWIRVDLERLNETNTPKFRALLEAVSPGDTIIASPQLVIDLLAGALTGSITHTAKADGTIGYKFNVSIDKANRSLRLSQKVRDDRKKLLRTLAISSDVFKAVASLRPDGTLKTFRVQLREQPDKQAQFALSLSLDVAPRGTPLGTGLTLTAPSRAATIRVRSLGDIDAAVSEQMIAAFKAKQATA